jgi:hypothetical protein
MYPSLSIISLEGKYKCCSVVDFAAVLVEFQCCCSSSIRVVVLVVGFAEF